MNREINDDFSRLIEYISNFNLQSLTENSQFHDILKPIHKKIFAVHVFVAEVEISDVEHNLFSEKSLVYLNETASDLSQSLLCWIIGAYKPVKIILRSAIETFLRATCGNVLPELFELKDIVGLFENAKRIINTGVIAEIGSFAELKSKYSDLCLFVHSTMVDPTKQLTALNQLPSFELDEAIRVSKTIDKILNSILVIMLYQYYDFINKMHFKNHDNFLKAIPKSMKKAVVQEKLKL